MRGESEVSFARESEMRSEKKERTGSDEVDDGRSSVLSLESVLDHDGSELRLGRESLDLEKAKNTKKWSASSSKRREKRAKEERKRTLPSRIAFMRVDFPCPFPAQIPYR